MEERLTLKESFELVQNAPRQAAIATGMTRHWDVDKIQRAEEQLSWSIALGGYAEAILLILAIAKVAKSVRRIKRKVKKR